MFSYLFELIPDWVMLMDGTAQTLADSIKQLADPAAYEPACVKACLKMLAVYLR